jgi:hypothetical protein
MYLETAIAERLISPRSTVAHSISTPLLLFFSSLFVLTIRLLATRIWEAFFVGEDEEEGKFWRVFSFEQAKRQKSGHRFPTSKFVGLFFFFFFAVKKAKSL